MRLIDADVLFISKEYCVDEAGFGASFYVVHKSDIDEAPTIEAEPVKHGRWEWMIEDMYNCTYCGTINHVKKVMGRPVFNYCPNCGAKMDLEDEE